MIQKGQSLHSYRLFAEYSGAPYCACLLQIFVLFNLTVSYYLSRVAQTECVVHGRVDMVNDPMREVGYSVMLIISTHGRLRNISYCKMLDYSILFSYEEIVFVHL